MWKIQGCLLLGWTEGHGQIEIVSASFLAEHLDVTSQNVVTPEAINIEV